MVIISYEMWATLETGCIIPLLVIFVSDPLDFILELLIIGARSQYFLDLILCLIIDEVWRWWNRTLSRERVDFGFVEPVCMKDRVYSHMGW